MRGAKASPHEGTMTIPKSLELKFAAAGNAKRASEARAPKEAEEFGRDWMGRRAVRREAREAAKAAEGIFAWLDSEDARALYALRQRHGVRVLLSAGLPPTASYGIALDDEPGTLWVSTVGLGKTGTVTVRSAKELDNRLSPEAILSLAHAIETGAIFDRIARELDRVRGAAPEGLASDRTGGR
jgi:hypothetical protein